VPNEPAAAPPEDLARRLAPIAAAALRRLASASLGERRGRVVRVYGTVVEGRVHGVRIGEFCDLSLPGDAARRVRCEVVGFTERVVLLSPLAPLEGISPQYQIEPLGRAHCIDVGRHLLGRVLDGFGAPLDDRGPLVPGPDSVSRQVISDAPTPQDRPRITDVLPTGVRAIDALLTVGQGQRVGLFAPPGCGKTTLLAAIARGTQADVVVMALVGERGREVREFTEHELEPELLQRCVIVCATSDRTAIERVRAAFTATAIAEGFRAAGARVLLLVDSLTRFARAQREIGLAAGEAPARAGYTPSVYAWLPRLLERAGNTEAGSITALYTVLLDGELKADPISEEAVSLLDGHVLLSRKLAEGGHYPAIDILPSLSRVMSNIVPRRHIECAMWVRKVMSSYKEVELLLRLGEYKRGEDAAMDEAVDAYPRVMQFLRQNTRTSSPFEATLSELQALPPR
jgi:type III secretion protein N (ATPase)